MDLDLRRNTVLLALSGSRAYGLHRPESDVDLKGVVVPPRAWWLGFAHKFEQADRPSELAVFFDVLNAEEQDAARATKLEGSVYHLRKFMQLATENNPNILDLLFCRDEDLRLCSPVGERLRAHRQAFLSARARHTFGGYAASQLKRIELHRRWLLHPPRQEPQRAAFALPERTLIPQDQLMAARAAIRERMDGWAIDYGDLEPAEVLRISAQIETTLAEQQLAADERWQAAARLVGFTENFIELLDRERRYEAARREWTQYQEWRQHRNAARAALEARFGYDTKHGAHLYRLLVMAQEILRTGQVRVWRGGIDAEVLQEIRAGQWPYDRLLQWSRDAEAQLDALEKTGPLAVPRSPNKAELDRLCVSLVDQALAEQAPSL